MSCGVHNRSSLSRIDARAWRAASSVRDNPLLPAKVFRYASVGTTSKMQRTLGEHIEYLERKIETLKRRSTELDRTEAEKREMEIDLGIAERALVHFKKAFELEQRLSRTNGVA
jgi:hypothetical protein